jgi:integrase
MWVRIWERRRNMGKLTALKVSKATRGRYIDGDGLYLTVNEGGSKQWSLRVVMPSPDGGKGKLREFGLGSANSVSLADARAKAAEWRGLAKQGIDPKVKVSADLRAQAIEQARFGRTFKSVASAYLAEKDATSGIGDNAKHRAQWEMTLRQYAYPQLGEMPVDEIRAAQIMTALKPIWLRTPETARRTLQRICTILDWANIHEWRNHPAPSRKAITKAMPSQPKKGESHFARVEIVDAPAVFKKLQKSNETVARLALQFGILTAARSGEIRFAKWNEIDDASANWTIPADRMKAKKMHVVPLSAEAGQLLERAKAFQRETEGYIFPGLGGNAMSDMTLTKAQKLIAPNTTQHGWRSTFRDWVSEETSFTGDLAEAALAHVVKNKVEGAYRRGNLLEKRRDLMAAWANYLMGRVDNVESIEEARAKREAAA